MYGSPKKCQIIKLVQISDRNLCESEFYSESQRESHQKELNRQEFDRLYFYILDRHIRLINENIELMRFVENEPDIFKCIYMAQFVTMALSLNCLSRSPQKFLDAMSNDLYRTVMAMSLAYFDKSNSNELENFILREDEFDEFTEGLCCPDHETIDENYETRDIKLSFLLGILTHKEFGLSEKLVHFLVSESDKINFEWRQALDEGFSAKKDESWGALLGEAGLSILGIHLLSP